MESVVILCRAGRCVYIIFYCDRLNMQRAKTETTGLKELLICPVQLKFMLSGPVEHLTVNSENNTHHQDKDQSKGRILVNY